MMLLGGMSGIGAWAYFSDFDTSSGNTFAAGTLQLKTNDADGVTATLATSRMAPGDTLGPQTIALKNSGTVDASSLDMDFTFFEADYSPNPVDMSENATAGQMQVTTLSYGGESILGDVNDANGNGYPDIYDLAADTFTGYDGIAAGESKNFTIAVQLRSSTGSDYQNDGIEAEMNFILNQ
jgi:predicted ribosomally synthesized peptide with SipW-like signal peptide